MTCAWATPPQAIASVQPSAKAFELAAANQQGDDLRWFVLDMIPLTQLDITGIDALLDLQAELASRGVELVAAGRRSESSQGVSPVRHYPTLRKAQQAYRKAFLAPAESGPAVGAPGA